MSGVSPKVACSGPFSSLDAWIRQRLLARLRDSEGGGPPRYLLVHRNHPDGYRPHLRPFHRRQPATSQRGTISPHASSDAPSVPLQIEQPSYIPATADPLAKGAREDCYSSGGRPDPC